MSAIFVLQSFSSICLVVLGKSGNKRQGLCNVMPSTIFVGDSDDEEEVDASHPLSYELPEAVLALHRQTEGAEAKKQLMSYYASLGDQHRDLSVGNTFNVLSKYKSSSGQSARAGARVSIPMPLYLKKMMASQLEKKSSMPSVKHRVPPLRERAPCVMICSEKTVPFSPTADSLLISGAVSPGEVAALKAFSVESDPTELRLNSPQTKPDFSPLSVLDPYDMGVLEKSPSLDACSQVSNISSGADHKSSYRRQLFLPESEDHENLLNFVNAVSSVIDKHIERTETKLIEKRRKLYPQLFHNI